MLNLWNFIRHYICQAGSHAMLFVIIPIPKHISGITIMPNFNFTRAISSWQWPTTKTWLPQRIKGLAPKANVYQSKHYPIEQKLVVEAVLEQSLHTHKLSISKRGFCFFVTIFTFVCSFLWLYICLFSNSHALWSIVHTKN